MNREELFAEYESAIVSVEDPGGGWTDPALCCVLRAEGAHVLTAWDPGFERPGLEQNLAANARMRTLLIAEGFEVWAAEGSAPDGTYLEPGFCIWGATRDRALAIAAEFGQFAIYEYDAEGHRAILPCLGV